MPRDLDLGLGHMAYHRASLIDPLHTHQISLRSDEKIFEGHNSIFSKFAVMWHKNNIKNPAWTNLDIVL